MAQLFNSIEPKSLARLQISMRSKRCSGQVIREICGKLVQLKVRDVEFQIADTLHRYNSIWQHDLDETQASEHARRIGDEWLDKNQETLLFCCRSFSSVSVKRWDFWIEKKDYRESLKKIESIYETDEDFRKLIDEEVEGYFQSIGRSLTNVRKELSIRYLLEEISVSEMTASEHVNEIYPGKRFPPEDYLARERKYKDELLLSRSNFVSVLL